MKIDIHKLKERCLMSEDKYIQEATQKSWEVHHTNVSAWIWNSKSKKWEKGTKESYYIYADNRSDVLAVAHLDTVGLGRKFQKIGSKYGDLVLCEHLDDRLGAYIILDKLPEMGIKTDVLLTTGEESMSSTARIFQPNKAYNWIFSFDRAGYDVALYQYYEGGAYDLIEAEGLTPAHGSYSDIADLDRLGVLGFNFGCGYYEQHTQWCCAVLDDTRYMIRKFKDFYHTYKHTRLDYTPPKYGYDPRYTQGLDDEIIDYDGGGFGWLGVCESCNRDTEVNDYGYCKECWEAGTLSDLTGTGVCMGCGLEFDSVDIGSDGYCWDCHTEMNIIQTGDGKDDSYDYTNFRS